MQLLKCQLINPEGYGILNCDWYITSQKFAGIKHPCYAICLRFRPHLRSQLQINRCSWTLPHIRIIFGKRRVYYVHILWWSLCISLRYTWRICASLNRVIIGSDNGLSPIRRQAIIWTNAGILLLLSRERWGKAPQAYCTTMLSIIVIHYNTTFSQYMWNTLPSPVM